MNAQPPNCTTLSRHQAVVWLTRPRHTAQPNSCCASTCLLDDGELRCYRAFRFAADAQLYLAAHVLLRTTLSRYANVPPADWRFVRGRHGRPEIAPELGAPHRLRFNLSHTRGLAACAVTDRVAVGVDVEPLDRMVDYQVLADRWFSRREARQLRALPVAQQRTRFLEYWTLKEAYIKACGGGLSIPLDGFSFERDANGRWQIEFASPRDGVPADWQFASLRPTVEHCLAVAFHRPGQSDLHIDVRETSERSAIHA